jgi:hypothetical protein
MKKLACILLSVLLFSCVDETVEKPENLLPEDKMVDMLYDISMLQAINSFTPQTLDSNKVEAKHYIFTKYKTDSLTFAQSHEYYASDMDKYEGIQKKIAAKIEKDKVSYGVKKKEEIKKEASGGSSEPKIRHRTPTVKASDSSGKVHPRKVAAE